jgi:hypothetical protein
MANGEHDADRREGAHDHAATSHQQHSGGSG